MIFGQKTNSNKFLAWESSQGKPADVHHTNGNSWRQMKRRDAALWLHVSRMFYFSLTEVNWRPQQERGVNRLDWTGWLGERHKCNCFSAQWKLLRNDKNKWLQVWFTNYDVTSELILALICFKWPSHRKVFASTVFWNESLSLIHIWRCRRRG